jgi:hypothetical protein
MEQPRETNCCDQCEDKCDPNCCAQCEAHCEANCDSNLSGRCEAQYYGKCEAEYYGKCGGQMRQHSVEWHCRPRTEDLIRGYWSYDSTLHVSLCEKHRDEIAGNYADNKLPELYGYDSVDAVESLKKHLHFTGSNPVYCAHCAFQAREFITNTGECTQTCIAMTAMNTEDYTWKCTCAEHLKCTCASFQNNELHWAVLTYVNGFEFGDYDCDACARPSWRDSCEYYKSGLVSPANIFAMAQANPELILQKNVDNKTPMDLIPLMIASLAETLADDQYLKCAEDGWGRHNMSVLKDIKNDLLEVLDSYAN